MKVFWVQKRQSPSKVVLLVYPLIGGNFGLDWPRGYKLSIVGPDSGKETVLQPLGHWCSASSSACSLSSPPAWAPIMWPTFLASEWNLQVWTKCSSSSYPPSGEKQALKAKNWLYTLKKKNPNKINKNEQEASERLLLHFFTASYWEEIVVFSDCLPTAKDFRGLGSNLCSAYFGTWAQTCLSALGKCTLQGSCSTASQTTVRANPQQMK